MSVTTNLALNEPAYNSTSPTWDQPLNYNATILDQMFGNTTGVSVSTGSSSTYTLITAPSATAAGSTSQAMRFNLTGALAANQTVLIPQSVAGMWVVSNNTSNAFTVSVGSNNGSNVAAGSVVLIPQGYSTIVYCDGTNVKLSDDGLLQGGTLTTLNVTGNSTLGSAGTNTTTINGKLTLNTTTTQLSTLLNNISETTTVSATAASGTVAYYVTSQSVLYYTVNALANFTINIAASSGTTLNSVLGIGQSVTVVFLNTNGSTAYYNNAVTIDGVSVTPKWQGGSAPTLGNINSVDIYTYTILKTASATYTVFASQSQFA
jgi:hypothetical protein